jgi:hypothetical protein
MALCVGKRTVFSRITSCQSHLKRCPKCSNVGCDRSTEGECTNQTFWQGKCLKCGAYNPQNL